MITDLDIYRTVNVLATRRHARGRDVGEGRPGRLRGVEASAKGGGRAGAEHADRQTPAAAEYQALETVEQIRAES